MWATSQRADTVISLAPHHNAKWLLTLHVQARRSWRDSPHEITAHGPADVTVKDTQTGRAHSRNYLSVSITQAN
jgi:hypothetical protein